MKLCIGQVRCTYYSASRTPSFGYRYQTQHFSGGGPLLSRGNRHDSERRYVHANYQSPESEPIGRQGTFGTVQSVMEHMGNGEQPYMVVRHHEYQARACPYCLRPP